MKLYVIIISFLLAVAISAHTQCVEDKDNFDPSEDFGGAGQKRQDFSGGGQKRQDFSGGGQKRQEFSGGEKRQ